MIETDVLIVGAGPAGLATAIALRRANFGGKVLVVEKSRAAGGHVLSGAVIDPAGFKDLLTEEEIAKLPVEAHVSRESFRFILGAKVSVKIPWVPPMMQQHGYPVGSLTKITRYLVQIAESLGVDVCMGYAVTELIEQDGVVVGARTGAKGVRADGEKKSNYLAPEEIRARVTVLAEGAAGVLTDRLIAEKGLAGRRPQSYAIGVKELIALPEPVKGSAGTIMHTFGYPVNMTTYGGGFVYHVSDSRVMVGYALGLDYADPSLDVHELFLRYKATSAVQAHIRGGNPLAYGAKVIPEGGYYAMPRPSAPGVLIVGDGAGLVDGLRIKGVHIAIQSGIAAAKAIVEVCVQRTGTSVVPVLQRTGTSVVPVKATDGGVRCPREGVELGERYLTLLKQTSGYGEVKRVRNVHGGFTYGAPFGVAMAGLAWATFGKLPWWMFGKKHKDAETLKRGERVKVVSGSWLVVSDSSQPPATNHQPLTTNTDRLTDVFLSGTIHDENQPCHLKLRDPSRCDECEKLYGSPCTRFCPAEVYCREGDKLRLDFTNCLHCKTCKVKCPFENVDWTFPQGGDGPRYTMM